MELKNIFSLLDEGIWQDFKGFLRDEKEKNNPTSDLISKVFWGVIASSFFGIIFVGFISVIVGGDFKIGLIAGLILASLTLLLWIFAFVSFAGRRSLIKENAYDIEVTPHKLKKIRNSNHKLGLCYWKDYTDNQLLLKSIYDSVERGCGDSYIICLNGKFGIYSFDEKRIITECVNDKITVVSDKVYMILRKGNKYKINNKGDRVNF